LVAPIDPETVGRTDATDGHSNRLPPTYRLSAPNPTIRLIHYMLSLRYHV